MLSGKCIRCTKTCGVNVTFFLAHTSFNMEVYAVSIAAKNRRKHFQEKIYSMSKQENNSEIFYEAGVDTQFNLNLIIPFHNLLRCTFVIKVHTNVKIQQ